MSRKIDPATLLNPSELDAPLVKLVGRSPHEMSPEELDAHITRLRSLRSTAQKSKKAVRTSSVVQSIQDLL